MQANEKKLSAALICTFETEKGKHVLDWLNETTDKAHITGLDEREANLRLGERRLYKKIVTKLKTGRKQNDK